MSLAEFGDTPIRDLMMLYEDMERIDATETLNAVFIARAGYGAGGDSTRHALSDLRETALGDEYDRRGTSKPEYASKEAYFEAMERTGHKAIEV